MILTGIPAAARRGERLHPTGRRGACRGERRSGRVRTAPRYRPGLGPSRGPGPPAAGPVGLRGLRWLDRELARKRPDRILIQYVPHAFGLKAMNLPFAAWIAVRARRVAPIWVMFHEVAFPFVRRPLKHNVLAVVNRAMVWAVAGRLTGCWSRYRAGGGCCARSARGPGRPNGCRSPAMWPPWPTPGRSRRPLPPRPGPGRPAGRALRDVRAADHRPARAGHRRTAEDRPAGPYPAHRPGVRAVSQPRSERPTRTWPVG